MISVRRLIWVIVGLAGLAASPLVADPTFPAFTAPVVDAAHILPPGDEQALERKLTDLQTKTGTQFAVATVPSLDGEEIEPYSNELFRQWKLGTKDANNGLLLVVAPKDHRLRFEVGYGLEGTMTDLQANLIITNVMAPKLKAGDPAGAIDAGVDDAIKVLLKDPTALSTKAAAAAADQALDPTTIFLFLVVFIVILIVVWRASRRGGGRGGSGWVWGAGTGAASTWSSGDHSDSGGGFSGGGGGDSGGGGSSGSW